MIRAISIRIAVLVPIALLTWIGTKSIMAQVTAAGQDPIPAPITPTITMVEQGTPFEVLKARAIPVNAKPAKLVSQSRATNFGVVADGNSVTITASADLMNKDRGVAHLWRLRVDDQAGNPVLDQPYRHQMFSMPESLQLSPTFDEAIQLPPGKHRVSLTLYALPRGYNVSKLSDDGVAKSFAIIHVHKTVQIN